MDVDVQEVRRVRVVLHLPNKLEILIFIKVFVRSIVISIFMQYRRDL